MKRLVYTKGNLCPRDCSLELQILFYVEREFVEVVRVVVFVPSTW